MVNACIRAHARTTPLRPEQLKVAIIGAGATGVELAAELHRTTREVVACGLDRVDPDKDIKVTLVEASDRVLPALPQRLSKAMVEGVFARLMYLSLYKMHELALHGPVKVTLDTVARLINRRTEPRVKLH